MQENYDNDTRGGMDLEVLGEMVAGGDILPAVIQQANFVMQGLIMPLLTVLGLAGNILSILVLHSQGVDMKVTFRRVLTMLAVFDCILISSITVSFSVPQLSTYWRDWIHPYIFPWTLPFIQISLNGSILSTVSVTMERYVSVVHPRHWIRTFSSAIYIVPVVLVTIFWNVTRFGELETCYREMNVTDTTVSENLTLTMEVPPMIVMEVPMICPTSLRTNLSYIRDYILIANFFVMGLLPFCLLAILNYKLYKTIKDSGLTQQKTTARQKRDQKIASLLILLVLVFGCCNVVRIITNLYEVFHMAIYGDTLTRWPAWWVQCKPNGIASMLPLKL